MPLQFERGREFIDAVVQHLHHTIIAAVDSDFAGPHRPLRFNVYSGVGRDDPGSANPSETFPHAIENPHPIVAPLILIITANKLGHSFPISVFNRM